MSLSSASVSLFIFNRTVLPTRLPSIAAHFKTAGGKDWSLKAAYSLEIARRETDRNIFAGVKLRFWERAFNARP